MSILSDIREGFQAVVEGITGLRVYAYEPDGALQYPCLVVEPTEEMPYALMIQTNNIRFDLIATLYIHLQNSADGWKELDEYRSPTGTKSIRAKVKTGETLNGKVTYAEVVHSGEASRNRDGNDKFWEFSCQFRVDVIKNIP
jgi:hypothetical protein